MSVTLSPAGSSPVSHWENGRRLELAGKDVHRQDVFDVRAEDAGLALAAGDLEAELLVATDGALLLSWTMSSMLWRLTMLKP